MLFSIVVALMVLLVAAFWVRQGFFSAVIFFFEAVIAALIAFGFYEAVNALWAESVPPGIGPPLAMLLLFIIPLVVLRVLTDKLVPDNVKLPLMLDRAGGGLAGFFTGMLLIGTPLVAIQMLQIGPSILGFHRLSVEDDGRVSKKSLGVFAPDAFTVGLVNMLTNGRFGGGNPIGVAKPDLLMDLYSARSSPQSEARQYVPADCLSVNAYWTTPSIAEVSQRQISQGVQLVREFTVQQPADITHRFLVCNVTLESSAADEGGEAIRFRVSQFRIVGPPPGAGAAATEPKLYLACGMSDLYLHKEHAHAAVEEGQQTRLVRFGPMTDFILGPVETEVVTEFEGSGQQKRATSYRFDVAFEVPEGFVPWYIAFKAGAKAEIKKNMQLPEPPHYAATAAGRQGPVKKSKRRSSGGNKPAVGKAPGGRTHVASAVEERTGVSALLPVPLSRDSNRVASALREGKLHTCHFWIESPEEAGAGAGVTEFYVPPGKKMVQIGAEQVIPLSMFGRALNFAATVATQIYVSTADGRRYFAQGVYAEAPTGGKQVFEIQYAPEAAMPERCLKKPKKLKKSVITRAPASQRKLGYLFLVDPGVTLVSFHAGSSAPQRLDIQVPP